MSPGEAEAYHARQVATFADSAVDMVTAVTMTNAEEAIGIARAARAHDVPAAISFTVETDGRLPDGQPLRDAIERVDAETGGSVAYFMINCAHPSHFADVLEEDGAWRERIGGLRANASAKSHAELDEAEELDEGDPAALGAEHRALRPRLGARGGPRRLLRHRLPPRGGHRPGLDGLSRGEGDRRPGAVSLVRHVEQSRRHRRGRGPRGRRLRAGPGTADPDAGHDAGVREGRAAGLRRAGRCRPRARRLAARAPRSTPVTPPAPTTSSAASTAGGRCQSPTSSRSPAAVAR